ncbi:MAG: AraC family transcriptional regulator [Clostridia bacterium]|nr:AraC family transcriptional regulator [Clostridia bacterium]
MIINASPFEDIINIDSSLGFDIVHKYDKNPSTRVYKLHNHDNIYEIVLLLGGDCEFEVEGNTYKLKPGDIAFTRPFEFHHIVCRTDKPYERIIMYLTTDFFKQRSLEKYLDIFEHRELGTGNIVSSDLTRGDERECIQRILRYFSEGAYDVAYGIITEFLYLLNKTNRVSDDFFTKNERMRDIIVYINSNLSEDLRLDNIAQKFFINKHYLCKSFKKHTGYTVNRYINYKRILLVQELQRNGQTLLQASMNAGFNSYAHFYKTYVKQTGKSPKTM